MVVFVRDGSGIWHCHLCGDFHREKHESSGVLREETASEARASDKAINRLRLQPRNCSHYHRRACQEDEDIDGDIPGSRLAADQAGFRIG